MIALRLAALWLIGARALSFAAAPPAAPLVPDYDGERRNLAGRSLDDLMRERSGAVPRPGAPERVDARTRPVERRPGPESLGAASLRETAAAMAEAAERLDARYRALAVPKDWLGRWQRQRTLSDLRRLSDAASRLKRRSGSGRGPGESLAEFAEAAEAYEAARESVAASAGVRRVWGELAAVGRLVRNIRGQAPACSSACMRDLTP